MTKINLNREATQDTFLAWAFLEMVGNHDIEKFFPNGVNGLTDAAVTLTVNGVELDVRKALDQLHSQYKDQIEERAKELLREKTGDLVEAIYDLQRKALQAVSS